MHSSCAAAPALVKGVTALRSICEQRLGKTIAITEAWYCYCLPEAARMTLATTATYDTLEDLLALPEYGRFELIDGQLVERKTGARSSLAATNLLGLVWHFVRSNNLGLGYCWPTPKCQNLCVQHAFLEGKKAGKTFPRKSTPRTLKQVGQQYPGVFSCA